MTGWELRIAQSREAAVLEADERRTETRFQSTGEVRLLLDGPPALAIPARILDVSLHGMRLEHMYSALTSGMMLQIESGSVHYTARVIWNRIKSDGVETGFYLL